MGQRNHFSEGDVHKLNQMYCRYYYYQKNGPEQEEKPE